MLGKAQRPRFEIWQAGQRIHSEDNPVRLKILQLLAAKDRRLADLVLHTRKAKSTLSAVHIPPLLEAGLVAERGDPADARVKHYHLLGHKLGSSDVAVGELRDAVLQYVQNSGALPLPALLALVDPRALAKSGARPAYTDAVARRIGETVAGFVTGTDARAAFGDVKRLLEAANLAELDWPPDGTPRVRARETPLQAFVERVARAALDRRFPGQVPLAGRRNR